METISGDVRIHFRVQGEGPPVLLVHGYPLSGELWDGVAERLAAFYRLIIPDLRGHGRSDAAESATMQEQAEDLLAVLRAADEERPVALVGMSMGGYVSLAFCRSYPERVRALALVNSRAAPDSEEAARGRLKSAEKVLEEGSAGVAADMVEKLFAPEAPGDLRAEWQARMARTDPRGIAAALRGMAARADSRELLRDLSVPVLVVVGSEDRITPAHEAREMAEAAGARLEVIPGAGHMTPVEDAESVAAVLHDFLAEVDRDR